VYARGTGRVSNTLTLLRNLPALLDLACHGPVFETVRGIARDFQPDVIVSDAEAWSHRVAADLHIPRISFDHIGLMTYCRPEVEWFDLPLAWFNAECYRWLMGQPDRVLVSSFYPVPPRRPDVKIVGPLLRSAVRELTPYLGDYLLAYFNQGKDQLRPAMLQALAGAGLPVRVYGTTRRGKQGPLTFLPLSNLPFLEDLAGCRAVISTAGNQLIGEALYLGKPVCVTPEACVEQRLNAAAVERLGIGMRVSAREFSATRLHTFLSQLDFYRSNIARNVRDGVHAAVEIMEQFLSELAPHTGRAMKDESKPAPVHPSSFILPLQGCSMRPLRLALSVLQNRLGAVPRPSWCTYLVLYRCNARCPMCDSWRLRPGQEMTPQQVRLVFAKIGRLDVVRLTGGEPFLREDFADVAAAVDEQSCPGVLHVTTNGSFPERIVGFAEAFPGPRRLRFLISFDGLETAHNASRGANVTFATAAETVERLARLRRRGIQVSINHTIACPESLEDHIGMVERFAPLGVSVQPVLAYSESAMYSLKRAGRKAEDLIAATGYPLHPNLQGADVIGFVRRQLADLTTIRDVPTRIAKRYYLRGLLARLQHDVQPRPHPPCVALRSHLRLLPDGRVPVCQFNTETLGNLLHQSFEEIWHGTPSQAPRQWVDDCPGCWAECEVIPSALYSGDLLLQVVSR
jgi:uncharacterized protein (TIGR00661 family)